MKISSKIDVITNSSSEVFIFKTSDPIYTKLLSEHPELKQNFTEFHSIDDIREVVDTEDYYGELLGGQCEYGEIPGFEDFYSNRLSIDYLLQEGITRDQIWNLYKVGYKNLVGISYATYETDCSGPPKELLEFLDNLKEENLRSHFGGFKPGTIIAIPEYTNYFGESKNPILVEYLGDLKFSDFPWCQDWKDYETRGDLINLDSLHEFYRDGFLIKPSFLFGIVNLFSSREATENEKQIYKNELKNKK